MFADKCENRFDIGVRMRCMRYVSRFRKTRDLDGRNIVRELVRDRPKSRRTLLTSCEQNGLGKVLQPLGVEVEFLRIPRFVQERRCVLDDGLSNFVR